MELSKNGDATQLRNRIQAALGEGETVRTLRPTMTVEIRDLNPVIEKEQIVTTLAEHYQMSPDEISFKTIRGGYADMKTTIVALPCKKAKKFKENERIHMGYVTVRIRSVPDLIRCFRCHEIGHMSYVCKEKWKPERSAGNAVGWNMGSKIVGMIQNV